MNPAPLLPSSCVYALQLLPGHPDQPNFIAGRLEHILSGRRHAFQDGATLLSWLAYEQSLGFGAAFLDPTSEAGLVPPVAPSPPGLSRFALRAGLARGFEACRSAFAHPSTSEKTA
jgi:hypothetical protein